jgi:CheY-like chemotaxis protein
MPTTPTPAEPISSPPPLRILHLEDDPNDAALIAWTLRTGGIQCRIVRVEDEQGYAAALRQGEMDLILSDCSIRGFSGLAALQMAKNANVAAPFVFVSGSAPPEMRQTALEQGATEYFSKADRIQLVFLAQRVWQNKSSS